MASHLVIRLSINRLCTQSVLCINSVFGSPEDGATSGIDSVQWRLHNAAKCRVLVWWDRWETRRIDPHELVRTTCLHSRHQNNRHWSPR